jgi:hypothetical protein
MASRFEKTGTYQDLVQMQIWTERRIAALKKQAKPDANRLKELMLEREAVKIAFRALNQVG